MHARMSPKSAAESAEPRPGSYAKGVARRQEILDRAIEVFAARGADRTSMRAIARRSASRMPRSRHYFGSLEELLVEVFRESERSPRRTRGAGDSKKVTPVEDHAALRA